MKTNIHLLGRHSNRTPFAYPAYKNLFQRYFNYCDDPFSTDYIISGFDQDFRENGEVIESILSKNPKVKFAIVSEEPLWDTIWCKDPFNRCPKLQIKSKNTEIVLDYLQINHFTSNVFAFTKLPYFITTDDNYFSRYSMLFSRNSSLTQTSIEAIQKNAHIDVVFMAAKRTAANLDFNNAENAVFGLSRYRTLLAENLPLMNKLIEGQGWEPLSAKRQLLTDWHLDKLATTDKQSRIISGIENTHTKHYISEKIFDAFATLSIPIYFADSNHAINKLVSTESFICLNNLDIDKSTNSISEVFNQKKPPKYYKDTQKMLHELFKQPAHLQSERLRIVNSIAEQFNTRN